MRITDQWGLQQIRFEFNDKGTLMPLDDHAAHKSNILGEIVKEFPMHYPSWHKILAERKARVLENIRFDLTPYMQSDLWPKISKGIEQHLAKIYTDNKSALKQEHWVLNPDGTYDMESSDTRDYPSLIQTYFDTHTVDDIFLRDEERLLYEEMLRLKDLGPNTPTGVPYTDDEIMAMVVRSDDKMSQLLTQLQSQHEVGSGSESDGGEDDEPSEDEDALIMEYLVNISKRRAFWSLNEDILKITILKTNTPYPSRKIRRIRACTHQRPQRNKTQYAVSRENQYTVLEIWNEYNILEDIKRGPYSNKSPICRSGYHQKDRKPRHNDKTGMDGQRLCKSKAKSKNAKVRVNTEESAVNRSGTEEYYWMQFNQLMGRKAQ
ncbi:hypothetical protein Tco_0308848 [Tanacetum coccineum]